MNRSFDATVRVWEVDAQVRAWMTLLFFRAFLLDFTVTVTVTVYLHCLEKHPQNVVKFFNQHVFEGFEVSVGWLHFQFP